MLYFELYILHIVVGAPLAAQMCS